MALFFLGFLIPGVTADFCQSTLYTDSFVCEDGSTVNSNGCCAATNRCPTSCMSSGWGMSGGVTTCTCKSCNYGNKLTLTQDERYLKATNYFRCRHGHALLTWSSTMATQAQQWADTCPSQGNNPAHSASYDLTPSSGQNVAAGQQSPEKAVEAWYSEITNPGYAPGTSGTGTGHYTALIWKTSTNLGCGQKACASGSPAPVHVCHYANSPPNFGATSAYVSNVPQSNTPTTSEQSCCQSVYETTSTTQPDTATGSSTSASTTQPDTSTTSQTQQSDSGTGSTATGSLTSASTAQQGTTITTSAMASGGTTTTGGVDKQISGNIKMTISEDKIDAAIADPVFKDGVEQGIADSANTDKQYVSATLSKEGRRLADASTRRLVATLNVDYTITLPASQFTPEQQEATKASLVAISNADLTTAVNNRVASAGGSYTITVSSKSKPSIVVATTTPNSLEDTSLAFRNFISFAYVLALLPLANL